MNDHPKSSNVGRTFSPQSLGYRLPAEWEPHQGTWLAWPHANIGSRKYRPAMDSTFGQLVRHLVEVEQVHLLVPNIEIEQRAKAKVLAAAGRKNLTDGVIFHFVGTNHLWIRDFGPLVLVRTSQNRFLPPRVALSWGFNGYDRKFAPVDLDQTAAMRMANSLHFPSFHGGLVMDGSGLEVDGCASLITTTACFLNASRDSNVSLAQMELRLSQLLGLQDVYWLENIPALNTVPTRIDAWIRFLNPQTVILQSGGYQRNEIESLLKQRQSRRGRNELSPLADGEVVEVPRPVAYQSDRWVAASYCHFYCCNDRLLIPQFDEPTDATAIAIFKELVPDRDVIGVRCCGLLECLQTLHSVMLQIPRPTVPQHG